MATDTHQEQIILWRLAMFEEMGFDRDAALRLTHATGNGILGDGWFISTHAVRRMLRNGCTHDLAMKIIL